MNPVPLKNKIRYANEISTLQRASHLLPVFKAKPIKSAVEWLKNEVQKEIHIKQDCKDFIAQLIDEAFHDVTTED